MSAGLHRHALCAKGRGAVMAIDELHDAAEERPASPSRSIHPVTSVRPSVKYVEVDGPNKRFLRQAQAPPRPVLPRRHTRTHSNAVGLRERMPLVSSLTGDAHNCPFHNQDAVFCAHRITEKTVLQDADGCIPMLLNVLLVTTSCSLTGSGKGGSVGELVCGGGTFKGEVLAGQPNGKGQFFTTQVP